jgi:hypothetical protein
MSMMMDDQKQFARKAGTVSETAVTCGNLTPEARFTEDGRVPSSTRYTIPAHIIELSFKPSAEEDDAYKSWRRKMSTQ